MFYRQCPIKRSKKEEGFLPLWDLEYAVLPSRVVKAAGTKFRIRTEGKTISGYRFGRIPVREPSLAPPERDPTRENGSRDGDRHYAGALITNHPFFFFFSWKYLIQNIIIKTVRKRQTRTIRTNVINSPSSFPKTLANNR